MERDDLVEVLCRIVENEEKMFNIECKVLGEDWCVVLGNIPQDPSAAMLDRCVRFFIVQQMTGIEVPTEEQVEEFFMDKDMDVRQAGVDEIYIPEGGEYDVIN